MLEGLRIGASGLAARQLERGDRGSVPASRTFAEIFECEASGRVPLASHSNISAKVRRLMSASRLLPLEAAHRANGWTKKSDVQLVEALHETDNDE